MFLSLFFKVFISDKELDLWWSFIIDCEVRCGNLGKSLKRGSSLFIEFDDLVSREKRLLLFLNNLDYINSIDLRLTSIPNSILIISFIAYNIYFLSSILFLLFLLLFPWWILNNTLTLHISKAYEMADLLIFMIWKICRYLFLSNNLIS
jgi:hypothetical protein